MEQIEKELRQFIIENFLYGQEEEFDNSDSFLDKGIIDSTGVLELVAFLEENYHISIDDEELIPENLDSISNIVRFLDSKLNHSKLQGEKPCR